jgi:hypothetical protein
MCRVLAPFMVCGALAFCVSCGASDGDWGGAGRSVEALGAQAASAAQQMVICHIPPGNPDSAQTIAVGALAIPAHMAHGDMPGPCAGGSAAGAPDAGPNPN